MSSKCLKRGVTDGKGQHTSSYRGDSSKLQQQQHGQTYTTTRQEADKSSMVVTGMLPILRHHALVLFDSG